jgi:predicted phosphohydrolase
MQDIGFDILGDLKLLPEDNFNWENKASSLYCIVTGNISSDLRTTLQTLAHLGTCYQGVFFVPGTLEYETASDIQSRTEELMNLTLPIPNVCILQNHIVMIDGIAIIGANGWANADTDNLTVENLMEAASREEDTTYLYRSIVKLQKHLDITKVIVVTNAVPHPDLYFKETPDVVEVQIPLYNTLQADTEHKVTHWVFGTYDKMVDTYVDNINYVSNPRPRKQPYWAKRITLSV